MTDPAAWHLKFETQEFAVVFRSGRAVSCVADGLEKADLFVYDVSVEERPIPAPLVLGTATRGGEVKYYMGCPRIDDDPVLIAHIEAATRGDFSWLEPPPRPPAPREEFSLSVFLPTSFDQAAIESACAAVYDDSRANLYDDDEHHEKRFTWFRPLSPDLVPRPGSRNEERLRAVANRWGRVTAWEFVARLPDYAVAQIARLAGHTDLEIETVAPSWYTRAELQAILLEDPGWEADWYPDQHVTWIPLDPPVYPERPPEYQQPWVILGNLIEHAVIYEDGGIVTIRAHAVIEADGRYTFTARHENGTDVTIGWATTPGAIVLLRGSPDLDDDAKAAAVLAAARAGDLGPARGHGATGGAG